jgi:hypothetical protein
VCYSALRASPLALAQVIALCSPCYAQAQCGHPWPPVRRMRRTPFGRSTSMRRSQGVTGGAESDSAKNSKASRSHAFDWPASENDMAILRAMSRLPYGFSATTLPFLQKYTGVPCMRAILRAVLAARRMPRSIPASHLSDLSIALSRAARTGCQISGVNCSSFFRFFATLGFGSADRVAAVFLFARPLVIT